mmetsp:Transcript_5118/g.13716  ORF Transcript_5118/g.13716 Transcript_5118/m.13716 type:complete len:211 (+) Transcript_5118:1656-2288(+)
MTRTKISTMDHLPRQSSHTRIDPRRETGTLLGGRNHRASVMSCLEYGHRPEKRKIITANSRPPAFQMSMVDLAMLNSKNCSTLNDSPASLPWMLTVAPRLRCPLRKKPMLPRMIRGIEMRSHRGRMGLVKSECVVSFSSSSMSRCRRCMRRMRSTLLFERVRSHRLCRRLTMHLMVHMRKATIATSDRHVAPTARRKDALDSRGSTSKAS